MSIGSQLKVLQDNNLRSFYILVLLISCLCAKLIAQNKFENLDVFDLKYARDPQVSPLGDKILYVRTEMDIMKDGKSSSIWIMNIDGSNHKKLTSSHNNESSPRWSPDGNMISYISNSEDGNGSEIFIFWVESNQYTSISQLHGSPRSLKWSPDGNYIGFLMFVPDQTLQLVTPPSKPENAVWAEKPRITERLKHEEDGSGYMKEGFTHIFYISYSGGPPRQVTSKNYNHYSFDWMKDSDGFIFSSNYTEDWEYDFRNSELYKIDKNGSQIYQLTTRNGPDYEPAISPDGKSIAYLGYDDKVQTYQINNLYLINTDGGDRTKIDIDLDREISSIRWSRMEKIFLCTIMRIQVLIQH